MIHTPQQLEFDSIAFPEDRTVLYAFEVAARWDVTLRHVIDLLEEGKLAGFDIAGNHKQYMRIPVAAVAELAKLANVKEAEVLAVIKKTKPTRGTNRSHWRIPREAYDQFIAENHSQAK